MASQLARIFFIDHRIRTRKKVTVKEIIDEHVVSELLHSVLLKLCELDLMPLVFMTEIKGYSYEQELKLLNFRRTKFFFLYFGIGTYKKFPIFT
jgi:hypothetical protein